MKLSRLFQSKASLFQEIVATDDLPRMEQLLQKKGLGYGVELVRGDFTEKLSPAMAELFADKLDPAALERWGFRGRVLPTFQHLMVLNAVIRGNAAAAEKFIEKKIYAFNSEDGGTLLGAVVRSGFPDDVKLRLMRGLLSGGHDKMKNAGDVLSGAVEKGFVAGLDLLADAGVDVAAQAQALLQIAARNSLPEMALCLASKYEADLDAGIRGARALGNSAEAAFLQEVKAQRPAAPKLPTVESLTTEVESLRETVRLLTERLGEKQLDKPVLKGPAR